MATVKQIEISIKRKSAKIAKCQKEIKADTAAVEKLKKDLAAAKKKEAEAKSKPKPKAKAKAKAKAKPKPKITPAI